MKGKEKLFTLMHQLNWFGLASSVAGVIFMAFAIIFYLISATSGSVSMMIGCGALLFFTLGRVLMLTIKTIRTVLKDN